MYRIWIQYVDGTFVIIEKTHETIYNIIIAIKFTKEEKKVTNIIFPKYSSSAEETITFYGKTTLTNKVLPYQNNNPTSHKRSGVITSKVFKNILNKRKDPIAPKGKKQQPGIIYYYSERTVPSTT